ncbi:MAG: carbohydrate kinase family protein [Patescibacteria group bacterium]|nr:carbohydrate kinase family protein [Patescibacteria group bacterium]MDD4610773.1 carbohydrate kinase family protein [Patescibacteria group bacterium]
MRYDFITIGGATEDITFYTKEGVLIENKKDVLHQKLLAFKFGAKVKIDSSYSTFGGGAANAAVNFSGLGFRAASLICVGNDERGRKIIDNLKKKMVDISLTQIVKDIETGFSFMLTGPGNEHIVFSNRGANAELRIANYELKILKKTEWIYISSLAGEWEKNLNKIFSVSDAKIAWNPGRRQIISGVKKISKFMARTDVFCVNKDEAIELAVSVQKFKNEGGEFLNNIKNLLKIIKSYGPEIVVITNGRHGVDVFDGVNFYHQNIIKEKRVADTTGVGDAFNSSFAAGLKIYQGNINNAIKLGLRNTASVVALPGAQNGLLTKKDL